MMGWRRRIESLVGYPCYQTIGLEVLSAGGVNGDSPKYFVSCTEPVPRSINISAAVFVSIQL